MNTRNPDCKYSCNNITNNDGTSGHEETVGNRKCNPKKFRLLILNNRKISMKIIKDLLVKRGIIETEVSFTNIIQK